MNVFYAIVFSPGKWTGGNVLHGFRHQERMGG